MAATLKRLGAGYGTMCVPLLVATIGASVSDVLKEINISNVQGPGNKPAVMGSIGGVCMDASGTIYWTETGHIVRKMTVQGAVTTLAGYMNTSGTANGTGSTARFSFTQASGLCVDPSGNVYVADTGNHCIRKITAAGVVTTAAGTMSTATNTDATPGTCTSPSWICINAAATIIYFTNGVQTTHRIFTIGTGALTTGATWTQTPTAICVDSTSTYLYAACFSTGNNIVRQAISGGALVILAGASGTSSTLNGLGTAATFPLSNATGSNSLTIDESGASFTGAGVRLYYANGTAVVRVIETVAGVTGNSPATVVGVVDTYIGKTSVHISGTVTLDTVGADGPQNGAVILTAHGVFCLGNHLITVTQGGTIHHTNMVDGFTHTIAGTYIAAQVATMTSDGNAAYNQTGYFNLYIVPQADVAGGLDKSKHRRFTSQAVAPSDSWFASITKTMATGDLLYFEALSPGLVYEISSLEMS